MRYQTRLALYCAVAMRALDHDEPEERITSAVLGDRTGINSTQVRRDLTHALGQVGKRGVGYKTQALIDQLWPLVERNYDRIKQDVLQGIENGVAVRMLLHNIEGRRTA